MFLSVLLDTSRLTEEHMFVILYLESEERKMEEELRALLYKFTREEKVMLLEALKTLKGQESESSAQEKA